MKTTHSRWTLQSLNSPIPVEKLIVLPEAPKLSDRINDYFQKTDPIRATLISGMTLLIISIIALPCAARCCCPQVFRLCGPITRLKKRYYKRKATKSLQKKVTQLARIKAATQDPPPDTISPSAPALEELQERVNMLQRLAFT